MGPCGSVPCPILYLGKGFWPLVLKQADFHFKVSLSRSQLIILADGGPRIPKCHFGLMISDSADGVPRVQQCPLLMHLLLGIDWSSGRIHFIFINGSFACYRHSQAKKAHKVGGPMTSGLR